MGKNIVFTNNNNKCLKQTLMPLAKYKKFLCHVVLCDDFSFFL
jgi:hypothetical protein